MNRTGWIATLVGLTVMCSVQVAGSSEETTDVSFRFLSKEETQQVLSEPNSYIDGLTKLDLEMRFSDEDATIEDYRAATNEGAMDFTEEQKEYISTNMQYALDAIKEAGYQVPDIGEVTFMASDMSVEFDCTAYTLGSMIALNPAKVDTYIDSPDDTDKQLLFKHIMAHELFHCYSRADSEFRKGFYEQLGFTVAEEEFAFAPEISDLIMSNPDVERHDAYATFTIDGTPTECTIVFASPEGYAEGEGGALDKQAGYLVPIDTLDQLIPIADVPDFYDVVGKNTDYVIDAEECAADEFGITVITGSDGTFMGQPLPDPELVERLNAYLKGDEAVTSDVSDAVESSETSAGSERSPEELRSQLENTGFLVQKGKLYEFETLKLASEGKVLTVFGNNAGSSYVILDVPPAPEQDANPGVPEKNWDGEQETAYDDPDVPNYPANPYFAPPGMHVKLRQDEAIVIVTKTAVPCKYWSFIAYDMFTARKEGKDYSTEKGYFGLGDDELGLYHTVFASIGSPVNFQNAKYDGDSPYGAELAIIYCGNQTTGEKVAKCLNAAGYPDSMINVMPIPTSVYQMGLEKGKDTFSIFGRISQPEDREAYEQYLADLPNQATVFRVTPSEELEEDPYPVQPLQNRGSGIHEASKVDHCTEALDTIRKNIIDKYSDGYEIEELTTEIAFEDGMTSYTNDRNAQGDVHDATYLIAPDFELTSDEDFVVVYGVNHATTGKAHYFNAVMHEKPMVNGVCSIYNSLLSGSADEYLGDVETGKDQYYVYKMARTQMDEYTSIIPYATGNPDGRYYGTDNNKPVFVIFRLYLEDETGVGADYNEVVNDRVIVFHKK